MFLENFKTIVNEFLQNSWFFKNKSLFLAKNMCSS